MSNGAEGYPLSFSSAEGFDLSILTSEAKDIVRKYNTHIINIDGVIMLLRGLIIDEADTIQEEKILKIITTPRDGFYGLCNSYLIGEVANNLGRTIPTVKKHIKALIADGILISGKGGSAFISLA